MQETIETMVSAEERQKQLSAIGAKGESIYREKVRPTLNEEDKGKYITIHTETGEWLIDADLEALDRRSHEVFGVRQPLYTLRAGFRSVFSFRPGLKLELESW